MKAKKVFEEFVEDSDPIEDMGIGNANIYKEIQKGGIKVVEYYMSKDIDENLFSAVVMSFVDIVQKKQIKVYSGLNLFVKSKIIPRALELNYFSILKPLITKMEMTDNWYPGRADSYRPSDYDDILKLAIHTGNVNAVKFIIDEFNLHPNDNNFYVAIENKNFKIIELFLKHTNGRMNMDPRNTDAPFRDKPFDTIKRVLETFHLDPSEKELVYLIDAEISKYGYKSYDTEKALEGIKYFAKLLLKK